MAVDIEVLRDVTDEIVEAFRRLLPQLSRSAAPLDGEGLRALVAWPGNYQLGFQVRDSKLYRFAGD